MVIDPDHAKIAIAALGTFSGTMITVGKCFHSAMFRLNDRINQLSESISTLDKNLGIQTAIFEQIIKKEKKHG